jgi:CBS domain-containing protein
MSLKPLISKEITSLPSTAKVLDAAKFMTDMDVGSVIIMKNDIPSGILTDRDIVTKVLAQGKDPRTVKVGEVMRAPLVTISENKNIIDATKIMAEHAIRRLPVVDSRKKLVGVMTLDDVLILLGQEMQNIATALKCEATSVKEQLVQAKTKPCKEAASYVSSYGHAHKKGE